MLLTPESCVLCLIDYQPAMYFGVQSHDRITIMHNTYQGVMEILKADSPYGIQVAFSKWALNGEE